MIPSLTNHKTKAIEHVDSMLDSDNVQSVDPKSPMKERKTRCNTKNISICFEVPPHVNGKDTYIMMESTGRRINYHTAVGVRKRKVCVDDDILSSNVKQSKLDVQIDYIHEVSDSDDGDNRENDVTI